MGMIHDPRVSAEATASSMLALSEARENLSALIDDVQQTGNGFTITRHGRPVAVLLANDDYESMVETLNILSDDEAMGAITEAEAEFEQADS